MSLFSRRSMMVVAGCALVLPLAAGTANAAFDLRGDDAAPVEDTSASVEGSVHSTDADGSIDSPVGDGAARAGENGARVEGCTASRACGSLRAKGLPSVEAQVSEVEKVEANALGEASKDGASVDGSMTAQREDLNGSADLSEDGGSLEADTPFGSGSAAAEVDGDIAVDGMAEKH